MLKIQLGLLSIPIQAVGFSKSRYSSTSLHKFSKCCNEAVGVRDYCKGCSKDLSKEEVVKGVDKDTILTESQQEALKEALESGVMEVLGIKDITETTAYDLFPFVQKAEIILPNTYKGYKKQEIKIFYSFKSALKELNKYCLVKLVQRNCEHIGVLMIWKGDLIFIELPFKAYNNLKEINKVKDLVELEIKSAKIDGLDSFSAQAQQFINNYKSKVNDYSDIQEEKKIMLKNFVEQIGKGEKEIKIESKNPFAT